MNISLITFFRMLLFTAMVVDRLEILLERRILRLLFASSSDKTSRFVNWATRTEKSTSVSD